MGKRIKTGNINWLSLIIFVTLVLQISITTAAAQETKQEKCQELTECLKTFYRDCYNENYLDKFSPNLIDTFTSKLSHEEEMSILDSYLSALNSDPNVTGYIVVYGGRNNKYGEYEIRVGRIKSYLFGFRNQDRSRTKFVNGGFREQFEFELWLSPIKNSFPPLSPTIAPEKVKFRGTMKPFGP